MERKSNDVFWVFAENGIEEKIYKAVQNKKDYTVSLFLDGIKDTVKNNQTV